MASTWALPDLPDSRTSYLRSDKDGSWWHRRDGIWWRRYDAHPPAPVLSWPQLLANHGPLTDVTDQMRPTPTPARGELR